MNHTWLNMNDILNEQSGEAEALKEASRTLWMTRKQLQSVHEQSGRKKK